MEQAIPAAAAVQRLRILIQGQVQGVGFRPWIFRHAKQLNLSGSVCNTPAGLLVEVQGPKAENEVFVQTLRQQPPLFAKVEAVHIMEEAARPEADFVILPSSLEGEVLVTFPPDLATCEDCRQELFNPHDRRHLYPFINCTACGPRFTIIRSLPYDRSRTSMRDFALCPACAREYHDPGNRRFEAQPNACPVCGPQLQLLDAAGAALAGEPVAQAAGFLQQGAIVAVKGLGGYHLACLAADSRAVRRLRERKRRPHKALAVMFACMEEIKEHCLLSPGEERELLSPARPIVVLPRKSGCFLPTEISPDSPDIGAFLPYTPLHYLLLQKTGPLIMTSGNFSEEPMVKDEAGLAALLGTVADYALTHNRPIVRQCDDSVLKLSGGGRLFLRRARGFVPHRISLPLAGPAVLACGADVKNTFCLTQDHFAYPSQHIGDLAEEASQEFYLAQVEDFCALHGIKPEVVAHDLHPDYFSTRLARGMAAGRHLAVQHHHAHIAACMAENDVRGLVLGVALDGTGYGPDHTVWGGEILLADYRGFERLAHLQPRPMPGGEQAILHPVRMALSYLHGAGVHAVADMQAWLPALTAGQIENLLALLGKPTYSPLTSSAGRLFDAVAALLGCAGSVTYEGQAAVQLQSLAGEGTDDFYAFEILRGEKAGRISLESMFREIMTDIKQGQNASGIAARFHSTLAEAVAAACEQARAAVKVEQAVLSGGVFQNELFLRMCEKRLSQRGFAVYSHHALPPNDGCISLGQAVIALAQSGANGGEQ
ncbi:carbamoyltransferase HypF [candidate division FCPU426 bacterium]|nr:carbamoyltransferase HypF [candidate division FCPU426 bacterium]